MPLIAERDVAAMLEIVHDGLTETGCEPFPSNVLLSLARLIPSDACVGYQDAEFSCRFRVLEQNEVIGEPPSAAVEAAFRALGSQNPLRCTVNARARTVLRLSDFLARDARRALEFYAEVWRPHGIDDALRLWLPAPDGRARSIYLERSERDYTDREKMLFALLRPHLVRIHANAQFRRRSAGGLTEREREVLGWIEHGKTNAEIAALLHVSPHTVRKHVENIFEKLGVHTRTAAVARARGDAPLA